MRNVNKSGRRAGLIATLLFGCMSLSAHAETVTTELFKSTTLVTGTSLNLTEFNLTTPGTLVIKLDDLKWPSVVLSTLSFSLTDATHVLNTYKLTGGATSGTWTFDVTTPGTLYGAIFAKPAAGQAGMYYANVSYQSVSAVPLPAAAWFLISGIAGLAAFKPKQKLSQIYA